MVFYYEMPTALPTLPKIVSKNIFSFPELSLLGSPKSHHHVSKNNKNSKFKLTMFHDQSLSKCLVHPNHVLILPLTLPPLCFGFHHRNPWKMINCEMNVFCKF